VNEAELAGLLREHASTHGVPGAAIAVLREGAELSAFHGLADTRTAEPVTAESRFAVGSLTKSMVATVVARLAQDRRLSLDDSVAAHVSELRSSRWAQRATVRDLLGNRSGLPLRNRLEFDFDAHETGDADVLAMFAANVAQHDSTEIEWSYTNAGWCLLGRLVETVTGNAWEQAMRDELFAPANMQQTVLATESQPTGRVSGHEVTADGLAPVPPVVARAFGPAGTSAVSTVGDLLRFATLHLDDPALAMLQQPQLSPRLHAWLDGWCLGWASFDWGGGRVCGWDSLINGERGFLRLVPDRRGAIVLLANSATGRAMYRSLFAELMPALFGITVPPLALHAAPHANDDLSRFAGVYGWPDRRVEVATSETGLRIGQSNARPLDDRTFIVDPQDPDNPTVTFDAFDTAGRPQALYEMLWGLPRLDG
jgi:CubicO group peptidase (beta-lactamase class C family)